MNGKPASKTPAKSRGAKTRQLSDADRYRLQQAQALIDEFNKTVVPRKSKATQ
jgi:hypothetical protein